MTEYVEPPEPGIYEDVPMEEYLSWDAASSSQLGELRKSPAHLKAHREREKEETDALRLGDIIHAAILEPDVFDEEYVVLDKCKGTFSGGKPCTYNAKRMTEEGPRCGKHSAEEDALDGAKPVKKSQMRVAQGIQQSIKRKQRCNYLINSEGRKELTMVWKDPATDQICKGRIDKNTPGIDALVDIKSTRSTDQHKFKRSIIKFGYHIQAAFYLRGGRQLGINPNCFVIVACEKDAPYGVRPFRLNDHDLKHVDNEVERLLDLYQTCMKNDYWPGYEDNIIDLEIPRWAYDKIDEEISSIKYHLKQFRGGDDEQTS